ncbi:hypothetical protein FRB93_009851 [Tulasnella sp. JGI-2019a]|nr:hypothetical protein FRB93_009851 [Tulasnella sp. JGI-2019a]
MLPRRALRSDLSSMASPASTTPDLELTPLSEEAAATAAALSYELPPLVRDVQQGWSGSSQAAAVVSALFAGIEVSFLTLIKTPPDPGSTLRNASPGLFRFLLLSTYAALCFNSAATITSLVISDQLGEMPFRSRGVRLSEVPASAHHLLENYKVSRRGWSWLIAYCYTLLFCGGVCVFSSIGVYIWLHEANSTRIVMTPIVVVCAGSLLTPMIL